YGVVCVVSFLGDCGPSCLEIIHKVPLCSSGVILHLSDDHRYRTRGYLAWSPRAIDSCLVLLPLTNNRTNSCLLLTKLLADGFVTHSCYEWWVMCRTTILSLTSLDNSLVLPMV